MKNGWGRYAIFMGGCREEGTSREMVMHVMCAHATVWDARRACFHALGDRSTPAYSCPAGRLP